MVTINNFSSDSKFLWTDGTYSIFFRIEEVAEEYRIRYGGFILPL